MTRCAVLICVLMLLAGGAGRAHDLRPADVRFSPFGRFIETGGYMIRFNVISAVQMEANLQHFLPELWPGWHYAAVTLAENATRRQKTILIALDGGVERCFQAYCDLDVARVSVCRHAPRYGGKPGRWLTAGMFPGESLAMLADADATATDIAGYEAGYLPVVPSTMTERFLVSCVSEECDRRLTVRTKGGQLQTSSLTLPYLVA